MPGPVAKSVGCESRLLSVAAVASHFGERAVKRTRFILTLEVAPGDRELYISLRQALKVIGRRWGLRCITYDVQKPPEPSEKQTGQRVGEERKYQETRAQSQGRSLNEGSNVMTARNLWVPLEGYPGWGRCPQHRRIYLHTRF